MTQVLVFGDSISHRAWDEEGGWVERLRKFFDKKTLFGKNFECDVYNLSVSGNSTTDLLKRMEFETSQRAYKDSDMIIIFAIGVNDSYIFNSTKKPNTSPNVFQKNVQILINLAKKFSSKIIFVGFLPVDQPKVDPVPWRKEISFKEEYVEKFDAMLKSICEKNKIHFVDLMNQFRDDYKEFLEDGVHPNTKGHERIFNIIKEFLIENKVIKDLL